MSSPQLPASMNPTGSSSPIIVPSSDVAVFEDEAGVPQVFLDAADWRVPISAASLDPDSQGSDFVPPSTQGEPSSEDHDSKGDPLEGLSSLDLARSVSGTGAIDVLRRRCQSAYGERTSARRRHEDGAALARSILDEAVRRHGTTHFGWCRLLSMTPNQRGYIQLSGEGVNKFASLQEVLLWSKGEVKLVESDQSDDPPEISHLCHNTRCTVREHICVEPRSVNNGRKGCWEHAWVPCAKKCRDCSGEKVIWRCTHLPRCVRSHPAYNSQQDLQDNGICRDDAEEVREDLDRRAEVNRRMNSRSVAIPSASVAPL